MRLIRCVLIVATAVVTGACRQPTPAQLNADNPTGITPAPYGMEEFFAAASHQPDPARARD